METRKIKLSAPITVAGNEVTEIEVRPTNIGDEEDALQQALAMKRGRNPMTVEICQFARATKLPFDALRSLRTGDYLKIREALNELNGTGRIIDPEDENPTMQNL